MEVSGEAADLVMKEGVQVSEEAIKLLARGAKNLAALLYALMKDQKKLYGMVGMNRLLSEQRPIEVLPLRTEDFDDFKQRAKKVGLLFSAIVDKKSDAPYIEILTNIDHLSQANYILEQMGYQPKQPEDTQPKKELPPARPEPSLQKYDILKHPNIHRTEDGGAPPYLHTPLRAFAADDLSFPIENIDDIEILEEST